MSASSLCRGLLLLATASLLSGQFVPGRYIVEFSSEPVAARLAREAKASGQRKLEFTHALAQRHREAIRKEQANMRADILAQEQVEILDCADLLNNGCFLRMSADQAARVAKIPGVRRVSQEKLYKPRHGVVGASRVRERGQGNQDRHYRHGHR
jgi:hypothetical protein